MLQKEMITEFDKLIKQPVHVRSRSSTKSVLPAPYGGASHQKQPPGDKNIQHPPGGNPTHEEISSTSGNTKSATSENRSQHDKCCYSPSDVLIQLKVQIIMVTHLYKHSHFIRKLLKNYK